MNEPGLKSCPFCGGSAIIIRRDNSYNSKVAYDIGCSNIECYLCAGADWHNDTLEEAAELWNKRISGKSHLYNPLYCENPEICTNRICECEGAHCSHEKIG